MINFDVSQSAALRISELLENEPENKIAIRVSVDGGGCSGFMYNYNLIDLENKVPKVSKYGNLSLIYFSISLSHWEINLLGTIIKLLYRHQLHSVNYKLIF